jgi:hypothetical protein
MKALEAEDREHFAKLGFDFHSHAQRPLKTAILSLPQGAGKSTIACELARWLGCSWVADEWNSSLPLRMGALHLTSGSPDRPADEPDRAGVEGIEVTEGLSAPTPARAPTMRNGAPVDPIRLAKSLRACGRIFDHAAADLITHQHATIKSLRGELAQAHWVIQNMGAKP